MENIKKMANMEPKLTRDEIADFISRYTLEQFHAGELRTRGRAQIPYIVTSRDEAVAIAEDKKQQVERLYQYEAGRSGTTAY